jgi:hypothetical protein
MRRLAAPLAICALLASLALVSGCATTPAVPPLTAADIVQMAKQGQSADQIIERLRNTRTLLRLQASDYVTLHQEGVPPKVLNYLQQVQIEDMRWRDRQLYGGWYGGGVGIGMGFYDCPWPYGPGFRRPYARGFWC